ncbi:hypothetical protein [Bradyrhizobium shewense]|uniref:hypothetical protein n=1 Tax=Bradyrhizobium shewense TaxID=1761772 RepID=UPI00101ADDB2|nr:hypothetical protein [Bradyrhizobium shewense]
MAALTQAAEHAISIVRSNRTKRSQKEALRFTVNKRAFSRNFKQLWFYSNTFESNNSLNRLTGTVFFLFWKNMSVTNLAINELVALVRLNSKVRPETATADSANTYFVSDSDYTSFIEEIWTSFFGEQPLPRKDVVQRIKEVGDHLIRYHRQSLERTIILEYYHTSALLHIPLSLEIDLQNVVSASGYIQSAGPGLYARNIEKAAKGDLIAQLNRYLDRTPQKKFFLVPYADEFFSPWEKAHSASSLRNGLDGVRFYFRKHAIGELTLQQMLSLIPSETNGRVIVASGLKEYWVERQQSIKAGACDDTTIWFVSDHNVHETDLRGYFSRGTKQYFFVYAQLIYNASQLNLFKERKPAWLAPVTLPHTLCGAMVNIAQDHWARTQEGNPNTPPIILDAFCGTGTTLIDLAYRFQNAIVVGFDKDSFSYSLCRDNLEFLAADIEDVETFKTSYCDPVYAEQRFADDIKTFLDAFGQPKWDKRKSPENLLVAVVERLLYELINDRSTTSIQLENAKFIGWVQEVLDKGFGDSFQTFLEPLKSTHKWLCYLAWRGLVNGRSSVRSHDDLLAVIRRELQQFSVELKQHVEAMRCPTWITDGHQRFALAKGTYSPQSLLDRKRLSELAEKIKRITVSELKQGLLANKLEPGIYIANVEDSARALENFPGAFDILITDPPYGFNTHFEGGSLMGLFGTFFPQAVRSLSPKGQLIVSLPEHSRNGRQVPFYQTRSVVTQQIITAAHDQGKQIVNFSDGLPDRAGIFRPPYYWFSPAGVSRSILKFSFFTYTRQNVEDESDGSQENVSVDARGPI